MIQINIEVNKRRIECNKINVCSIPHCLFKVKEMSWVFAKQEQKLLLCLKYSLQKTLAVTCITSRVWFDVSICVCGTPIMHRKTRRIQIFLSGMQNFVIHCKIEPFSPSKGQSLGISHIKRSYSVDNAQENPSNPNRFSQG